MAEVSEIDMFGIPRIRPSMRPMVRGASSDESSEFENQDRGTIFLKSGRKRAIHTTMIPEAGSASEVIPTKKDVSRRDEFPSD